jgi:hypothetical protein
MLVTSPKPAQHCWVSNDHNKPAIEELRSRHCLATWGQLLLSVSQLKTNQNSDLQLPRNLLNQAAIDFVSERRHYQQESQLSPEVNMLLNLILIV